MSLSYIIFNLFIVAAAMRVKIFQKFNINYEKFSFLTILLYICLICNAAVLFETPYTIKKAIEYILAFSLVFFPFLFIELFYNFFIKKER
jgi:hypothetical protein